MRLADYLYADWPGVGTLYKGDCLEILPLLEAGSVDAVVTDPPYGINIGGRNVGGNWRGCTGHGLEKGVYASHDDTYESFVSVVVPRINAALEVSARGIVFTGPHIHEQRKPDAIGGIYCPAACGRHSWGFKNFLPALLYGPHPSLHLGATVPTAINSSATCDKNTGHPCPKPVEWMLWAVELTSMDGDLILDPFLGSGTTAIACIRTGRRFIGIEISEAYCEIARKRIERELEQPRLPFVEEPARQTQRTLMPGDE